MNIFVDSFTYWLADFLLATAVLLVAALAALALMKQPAKRLAVTKATLLSVVLVAGLCAMPSWSFVHLASSPARRPAPEINASPASNSVEPMVSLEAVQALAPATVPETAASPLATPPSIAISWDSAAVALYAAGGAATLIWFAVGMASARRLLCESKSAPPAADDHMTAVLQAGQPRPTLRISPRIGVAAALGVMRPTVLLPESWLTSRSAAELRTVLAHECAHLRNGDLKWLAVSRLVSVLLWPQPLYWLLRRQLRLDQETLADAAAADLSCRKSYAEQLVAWARNTPSQSRPALASAVGLWESSSQLRRRVSLLLDEHFPILRECSTRVRWLSLVACGVTAIGLSMVTFQPTLSQVETPPLGTVSESQPDAESSGGISRDPLALPVAKDELAGVVEDESGKPLAGVTVDAWTWFPGNETTTDVDGRFTLKGLDTREPVELQFTKVGFCPRLFVAEPVGKPNWVVRLNCRTYLEGRVLDPEGRPVAGINLRATRGPFETAGAVWTETETDSDGRYRIYLEPDSYELRVRRPGVGVARYEKVVMRENDRRDFDLQLERGPTFRARVIDSVTGEPVGGIRLFRWREPGISGSSNEQGELNIENMLPGRYEFNVSADSEQGRFPDVAGEYARWWSPEALNAWQQLDLTDGDSSFQRNFDSLEFDIRAEMKPVTIVVERCVRVGGQVLDPDGNPVKRATVAPAKTGSGNSLTGDTRYSVKTGADGKFAMRLPASGAAKYNLVAHDGDYEEWRIWANGVGELLETKPGDRLENMTLQLTRPCVVRGRVLDANGKPLANHPVRAHAADKLENRYYDPTTKTNDQGEFELKFVRAGKQYIQADPFWLTAEDGPRGAWKLVDVSPDRAVEGIELRVGEENQSVGTLNATLQELREKADQVRAASDDAKNDESATKAQTKHTVVPMTSGSVTFVATKNPVTPWDYKPNVLAFAVQDETGAPVERVEAIVYRFSTDTGERSEVGRAATKSRGEVEFAELVDPKWAETLQAMIAKSQLLPELRTIFYTVLRRDGMATVLLPASDYSVATTGIKRTVRMRPAAVLSGRVTDRSGKPVVGALVAAGNLAGSVAMEGVNAVRTDSEGRYRLSNVVGFSRAAGDQRRSERNSFVLAAQVDMSKMYPAIYDPAEDTSVSDLTISHPDFAITTVRGGDVPGSTDVVMQPNSTIVGRVVEFGNSKPVMGVRIRTVGNISDSAGNQSLHIASTLCDAAGEYRLNNLPAGNYEVWAEEPSDVASRKRRISRGLVDVAASAEKSPVRVPDIVLGPGGTIRGRLIDTATGKTLASGDREMTVKVVTQLIDPYGNQGSPLRQAAVDREGRFSVQAIPGKSRVFLMVYTNEPGSNLQGDFRSADKEFETGPVFDLKHGESTEADFKVWSQAQIEEQRAKLRATLSR